MRSVLKLVTAVFGGGLLLQAGLAQAAKQQSGQEEFPLKQAPTKADWHTFIQASDAERLKIWSYQTSRGRHLQDWSWGWRLGWVRVCGRSDAPFCGGVLQEALLDKALVVRAEAASALGRLYERSANPAVVRILGEAYHNARNARRGRPLFVQRRILFALHQIGGDEAQELGRSLANEERAAAAYWQQLEHTAAW